VLRAIEDRDAGPAGGGEELLGGLDGAVRIDAASVRVLLVDLDRRPRTTTIDEIVKIDWEEGRTRADKSLPAPAGVKPQVGFRDHVLPAMIVELFDGCHPGSFRDASASDPLSGSVLNVEAEQRAKRVPAGRQCERRHGFANPGMRLIVAIT